MADSKTRVLSFSHPESWAFNCIEQLTFPSWWYNLLSAKANVDGFRLPISVRDVLEVLPYTFHTQLISHLHETGISLQFSLYCPTLWGSIWKKATAETAEHPRQQKRYLFKVPLFWAWRLSHPTCSSAQYYPRVWESFDHQLFLIVSNSWSVL